MIAVQLLIYLKIDGREKKRRKLNENVIEIERKFKMNMNDFDDGKIDEKVKNKNINGFELIDDAYALAMPPLELGTQAYD